MAQNEEGRVPRDAARGERAGTGERRRRRDCAVVTAGDGGTPGPEGGIASMMARHGNGAACPAGPAAERAA